MVTRRQKLLLFGGVRPWLITQPATSLLFQIDVRSKVTGQVVTVSWGDGSSNTYTLSSTVNTAISHVYAGAAVYNITIAGATSIKRLTSTYVDGRSKWGADITSWTSLTWLDVQGNNTITGSVAALTSLTYLVVLGLNTLTGSVAALTSLTTLNVQGNNTLSGSVAALTSLTFLAVTGSNTITGSVASLTSLTYLYVQGNNTLSGSVAALTSLTFLLVTGSNTITWAVGPLTLLATLNASNNALNQAAVDAILLAMYTARATYTNAAPVATLGGTNAAPSGVYADEDPPVTGKGMAYELVNDPEGELFRKWSISFTL